MPTSIYDTPWVPKLNGKPLPSCAVLDILAEQETFPDPADTWEKPWTPEGVASALTNYPKARAAVEESLLGIWRCKYSEEDGSEDKLWMDHLEAWMVRRIGTRG
jgi:hypothetical protein